MPSFSEALAQTAYDAQQMPEGGDMPLDVEVEEEPEEPYDLGEKYWLSKPFYSGEFAEDALRRFREGIDVWRGSAVGWTCWTAYRAYHNINATGVDVNSPMSQLMAAGEQGELLAMAIPHYRSLVRHQIALFTAERPEWDPIARTSDSSASRQVPAAANLLDHVASTGVLDQRLQEQVETMMTTGSSYYVTDWDVNAGTGGRGWFREIVLAPWEMVHERVRHYEDAKWWIFRTRESRWDWVAFFAKDDPEKARQIAEYDAGLDPLIDEEFIDRQGSLYGDDGDRVVVLNVIAKPSLACPTGRYAKILSQDVVLVDSPYPYGDEVTISRMCASEFLGTSVPYSDSWGALAGAEAYNAVLSMIMTRVDTCGVPNFCLPEGSELDYQDIVGGNNVWRIPPGGEKPQAVDLLQLPDVLPGILELLKGEMDSTGGVNSVTRGQPQENVSSGSMAALMQTMAMQFNNNLERAWVLNLERVGTHHVKIFQRMASEPMFVDVCGQDNKWLAKQVSSEDVSSISRVAVKTASAISKTKAGRAEIADRLFQQKAIQPEEYLNVIQTGQLDRLFQGPVGKLNLIKAENEKLGRGEQVSALVWEDHQLHVREHESLLTTDLREDPALVQIVFAHLDEHYQLWSKLSREDPDRLAAMGVPPLPMALSIGQQAMAMQSMAMGAPPPQPAQHGPPPAQNEQPNTQPSKAQPGPKAAPPGVEPSSVAPTEQPKEPKPARNPMTGEPTSER